MQQLDCEGNQQECEEMGDVSFSCQEMSLNSRGQAWWRVKQEDPKFSSPALAIWQFGETVCQD